LVEQAPSGLRKAGADRGLVTGWEVAFDDEHVIEDFVGLGKKFDDRSYSVTIIHSFRPIGVG
jgi:hypothetical protein